VSEWVECPYYAVKEHPGGGYYIVNCTRLEGHSDSHKPPEGEDVAYSDWEHPETYKPEDES
jgi:hypothetical protein